jgi:hypothetical protein
LNISLFKSTVSQKSYLPTNRFEVTVSIPKGLRNTLGTGTVRDMKFYVSNVVMPGVSLFTSSSPRYGYGMSFKRPYAARMQDIGMVVYNDANSDNLNFIRSWVKLVSNYDFNDAVTQLTGFPGLQGGNRQMVFEHSYPVDYVADITIDVYDYDNTKSTKVTLIDAYPINVGDVGLGWSSVNQVMTFGTTMTYRNWYTEEIRR